MQREGKVMREEIQKKFSGMVNKDGSFTIPSQLVQKLGLNHAAKINMTLEGDNLVLLPNIHSLAKVYIEPTSKCNLSCKTCIRNTWKEPMGDMDIKTFDALIEQLKSFKELQSIMFGGFGEPTFHKDILYMIQKAKSLGVRIEMVTNGTTLNETFMKGLIESKLDTLWVSFDGTDASSYEDVREGANFNKLVSSLRRLRLLNEKYEHAIEIAIAFVVMKKNANDLQSIHKLAQRVGAKRVSVSNVLPYSEDMQDQMLYTKQLVIDPDMYFSTRPIVSIPRMDIDALSKDTLFSLLHFNKNLFLMRKELMIENRSCRFIKERCTFIRWDGQVAPCMGLLHSYTTFIHGCERKIDSYTLGDILSMPLKDIWDSQEYSDFREKVDQFDFSPCYLCGGCENIESNHEDCSGNKFPVCGACIWPHGFIQCP